MKFLRSATHLRFAAVVAAVGAAGTLTLGGTWALFGATESGADNTFSAGTVTVGTVAGSTTCTVSTLMPGDSSTAYGSGSATVTLTFHAVQSSNQPIGSCAAGRQCNTIVWS